MLRALELTTEQQARLKVFSRSQGLEFISSPFDEESLRDLVRMGVKCIKLPSGEITNGPLLLAAARTGLPLLLSTGMSSLADIERALAIIAFGMARRKGYPTRRSLSDVLSLTVSWQRLRDRVTLLHCTSQYPAPFDDVNLHALHTLRAAFALPVGYSDHTTGLAVPIAAVAMGALVIEKHFTLDRHLPGPDHRASLEPHELAQLVKSIREVEASLGDGRKRCAPSERETRTIARKSVVALMPIHRGSRFSRENLGAKRPGTGRSPIELWSLFGKCAKRDYEADEFV